MFWSLHKTKILSILLMLSVALNIALISWAGGKKAAHMHPDMRERIANFREIADRDSKKEARGFLWKNRKEIRDIKRQIMDKKQEVDRYMAQETVDKQALAKSLDELRSLTMQSMELMQKMTLEVIADMPVEKRQEIMKRRQKGHHKENR